MPKKIRELKAILFKDGFVFAGKDGDDAPQYLEKQVNRVLKQLGEIEEE